jgi:hypothetical protein
MRATLREEVTMSGDGGLVDSSTIPTCWPLHYGLPNINFIGVSNLSQAFCLLRLFGNEHKLRGFSFNFLCPSTHFLSLRSHPSERSGLSGVQSHPVAGTIIFVTTQVSSRGILHTRGKTDPAF